MTSGDDRQPNGGQSAAIQPGYRNHEGDFGIVANVVEVDRLFRLGAKAWLADGTGGEGWERFKWIALARGGRRIEKWCPTWRFGNFRAAFIPPPLSKHIFYIRGTRAEMEETAKQLADFADKLREKHPDRRGQRGATVFARHSS